MAKVSLIIPTFNRPHLLPRAVESAMFAGRDVEVIVVDDASMDGTAAVCASLPGIKYVRLDRNQGVAGARNVCSSCRAACSTISGFTCLAPLRRGSHDAVNARAPLLTARHSSCSGRPQPG